MKRSDARILISGGGTGGHVFPAIAIARAIKRLRPDAELLFIGAKGRMEMEKVPAAGFPIKGLWISGIQRSFTIKNLLFPLKVVSSLFRSWQIIRKFKPSLAIGVGGYASAPALWMASKMGIPTLIQEQNAFPGIANRLLSRRADVICVAYEGMEKYFPAERIHLTGNPVRQDIIPATNARTDAGAYFGLDPGKPTILVIGGSLGARTLNLCMKNMLTDILQEGYQLIWQTGKGFAEEALQLAAPYQNAGIKVFPFIDRMDMAYSLANLVVSRAGAIAIAELCAAGKSVVLVPSPNVAEDHQRKNAEALVSRQAAVMVLDAEASTKLRDVVIDLMKQSEKLEALSQAIKSLAMLHADESIARIALEISGLTIQDK